MSDFKNEQEELNYITATMRNRIVVNRESPITGELNSLEISNISHVECEAGIVMFEDGASLRKSFPNISTEHAEYIVSGVHPNEWESIANDLTLVDDMIEDLFENVAKRIQI